MGISIPLCTESNPLTDRQKLSQATTSAIPTYTYTKLGANPPTESFYANAWITTIFVVILFWWPPTGQTTKLIFTLDGSNDADSCGSVHF